MNLELIFTIEIEEIQCYNRVDKTIDKIKNWWTVGSIILIIFFWGVFFICSVAKKSWENKHEE